MESQGDIMDDEALFSGKLMLKAEQYMNRLGIQLVEKYEGTWDSLKLERYTAIMEVRGDLKGYFMVTVDVSLAYALVNHYILEAVQDEDIPRYADKVVAEIANIIAGSALHDQEDTNIVLGSPIVYRSADIRLKPNRQQEQIKSASTENGFLQCMFIGRDNLWLDF
jgi:CheY-specific phosphatase CheX